MSLITEMMIRPADRREEETMHLFDAETREEVTLCRAYASIHDRVTVQDCLRQLIDGILIRNVCRTCMGFAARWAEGHFRKLEAVAFLLRARALRLHEKDATRYRNSVEESDLEADRLLAEACEYSHVASRLARETGGTIHVWTPFSFPVRLSSAVRADE